MSRVMPGHAAWPEHSGGAGDTLQDAIDAAAQHAGLKALARIARQQTEPDATAYPSFSSAAPDPTVVGYPVIRPTAEMRPASTATSRTRMINTEALKLSIISSSRGSIAKVSKMGPTIAVSVRLRALQKFTFVPMLRTSDRIIVAFLSLCWLATFVDFWFWWLMPSHEVTALGTALNSVVLAYLTGYPAFYLLAANRLHNINPALSVPFLRVAFIVTRAPSEPWDVARTTLEAMLSQKFPIPYDVWLADEAPTPEILAWSEQNGVSVSTRQGVDAYHRATWPRRTKCKEGNLAYFYDHWGYENYDVVAQLDCDHIPSPGYLADMVRPFADPAIGYVAAPSVCDTNADSSWAARGRLFNEASFHGAYQLGHSAGMSPVCIGSHYAVRTRALRSIGGIGPELAEDFTTSYLLTVAGWQGAFAIQADAHGDGPPTFGSMLVQEYQWSRSITVALLSMVWPNIRRLPLSLQFRFGYHLFFYMLLITSTLGGALLCLTAAVTGKDWVHVNYGAFVFHLWLLSVWLMILTRFLRRRKLLRPADAPSISWENTLYVLTRWPYIVRGVFAGVMLVIRPRPTSLKVTPKGAGGLVGLPVNAMVPFLIIAVAAEAAALTGELTNHAVGYVFLCLVLGFMYTLASVLIPLLHALEASRNARVNFFSALRQTSIWPTLVGLAVMLPLLYAALRYPGYAQHNLPPWHLGTLLSNFDWSSLLR